MTTSILPPPTYPITTTPLPVFRTVKLKNDRPIYIFSDDTVEAVKVSIYFNAGAKDNVKKLLPSTVVSLWQQGTAIRSGADFADAIDSFGGYLSITASSEFTEITVHTLNKYFIEVMDLVFEMISNPGFNQKDLDIDCTNRHQRFTTEYQKTGFTVGNIFNEAILGLNHPLGRIIHPEDAEQITLDDVWGYYNDFLRNGFHSVVMAGKVKSEMENWLMENLGYLSVDEKRSIGAALPSPTGIKRLFYTHPEATQSSILIGSPFVNRFHPDFATMRGISVLFGGYFGSRLMANLREDKGYTYGVSSFLRVNYTYGHFMIRTDVGADVTIPAIDEIYNELNLLCKQTVAIEELDLVRSYMLGTSLRSVDGALAKSDLMANLLNYGLGVDAFQANLDALNNLTPEIVNNFANKYLRPEMMTIAVSGRDNLRQNVLENTLFGR